MSRVKPEKWDEKRTNGTPVTIGHLLRRVGPARTTSTRPDTSAPLPVPENLQIVPQPNWTDFDSEVRSFCEMLACDLNAFEDDDAGSIRDIFRLLEKPHKWTSEYERWVALGRPTGSTARRYREFILRGQAAAELEEDEAP